MELCPGVTLPRFLRTVGPRDRRLPAIAGKIHDGLEIYARLFNEPYFDFCMENILYDEAAGALTFLDFSLPPRIDETTRGSPLEASLGNMVGCGCYELARPARLLSSKHGYLELMRTVLAAFDGQILIDQLCAWAEVTFLRLGHAGTLARRSYYKSIGAIMVRHYYRWLKLSAACSSAAGRPGLNVSDTQ
jgi:hypothetical protein